MSTRRGRGARASAQDLSPSRGRKGVSPPRSPARTRRSSRSSPPARSPSRRSPARKSPGRKSSKYPARKSPSRTTKETIEIQTQKLPSKRVPAKTEINFKDKPKSNLDAVRTARLIRSEYSIKDLTIGLSKVDANIVDNLNGLDSTANRDVYGIRNRKPVEDLFVRRSTRLVEKASEHDTGKSISKSLEPISLDQSSDEDIPIVNMKQIRKLETPVRESLSKLIQAGGSLEFFGRIGSFISIILLPLIAFTVLLSCAQSCIVNYTNTFSKYRTLSAWYSSRTFILTISQIIMQGTLASLPILGIKAHRLDDSGKQYCFNAFFSSLITILLVFSFDVTGLFNSNDIFVDYVRLAASSYILAVLLSLMLYLKSRKMDDSTLNSYGNTGYVLYDFWIGREIHPHFFKLDIKVLLSRFSNITSLLLLVLLFKPGIYFLPSDIMSLNSTNYTEILAKVHFKPTVLVFTTLQIIYQLNFIIKEQKITATFFWNSEGVGYLQAVSSALYPFYFTTISKYIVEGDITLSTSTLIAASVLFAVGFLIILISNTIKYEFRKNPLNPTLGYLDSMPTFHGKRLLVSSLWGIVRHPNYSGDILIHCALALPGIMTGVWIAAVPALTPIALLLHRSWRDHNRCKRRYGAAWQRYCKRVPKVFIPKVL